LDGMKDQQALYESYPGIWLSLHYMIRVGEIVIGPYASATKETVVTVTLQINRKWLFGCITKVKSAIFCLSPGLREGIQEVHRTRAR